MSRRRAFSVLEVLITVFVAAMVLGAFLSAFRSSYDYARQTRNRAVAIVLGRSLMDEVEAHPYGAPAPRNWSEGEEIPAKIWIEGRPVQMTFRKKFSYRNASFVGSGEGKETFDVVTIVISWKEATGPQDSQELRLSVPVWR